MKQPSHPGRVLKNLYIEPSGSSTYRLARDLGVPRTRIERLVKEKTSMTVDTAIRLARRFSTSPAFWLNMQTNYDLSQACIDVSHIEPLETAEKFR